MTKNVKNRYNSVEKEKESISDAIIVRLLIPG